MTLIVRLLAVAAALPFVLAHRSSDCKGTEFFWGDKEICIPYGGFPNATKPPKGTDCPKKWSWNPGKNCCLPSEPEPPASTPSCNKGWGWNKGRSCCEEEKPSTTKPSTPTPSSKCKGYEFYWGDKEICVPYGGFPNPPKPPKGTDCPKNWSWNGGKGCCIPHEPPKPTPPSCNPGWGWDKPKGCCTPKPPTSTVPVTPPTPTDKCKPGQWWWGDKGCCLPHGGSPNPPKPPKDTDCPPNWEWNPSKKHCVPKHPNQPPPQCPPGWGWNGGSTCCTPHTPTPPAPTPSSKPGKGGYHGHKRAHKARNVSLCPNSMEACPIAGLTGLTDDWECLDTRTELQSCGGCASTGAGEDCTAIPGAWNVGCNEGKCVVFTCAAGYLRSLDNKTCVKI
ncbi:hypothetical protein C8Q76DRAFT_791743 [Earliella scabrosa]|nr:hypothetical protein C8Q76DRAFT_791743 [Earliella scabrosa]